MIGNIIIAVLAIFLVGIVGLVCFWFWWASCVGGNRVKDDDTYSSDSMILAGNEFDDIPF